MEIERKFLIRELPCDLTRYQCLLIQQAYLCTDPVVRIRRQDEEYVLTYKGKGLMVREEYNLPLNQAAYEHLLTKADGNIIIVFALIPAKKPAYFPKSLRHAPNAPHALPVSAHLPIYENTPAPTTRFSLHWAPEQKSR